MIYKIVNTRGRTRGYLVDDIYINNRYMKFITSSTTLHGSRKLGVTLGDVVVVDGVTYRGVINYLNMGNIDKLLKTLTRNGVVLNYVIFVSAGNTPLKELGFSSLCSWLDVQKELQVPNNKSKKYLGIDNKGNIIAYLETNGSIYREDSLFIMLLETKIKGKMDGTKVVSVLRSYGINFEGFALVSSARFWEKVGVTFLDDTHFIL